jgi:hypothetical protein
MELQFTTVFHYFVKDYLLPDWQPSTTTEPGSEAGNEADRALVAFAKQHALPLITNEGYTQNGIVDEKMRKLAKDEGVQVFTPREFWLRRFDETKAIEGFFQAFLDQAPLYMVARRKELGEDKIREVLDRVYGYYRLVLLGEVAGSDVPVRVSVV